MPHAYLCSMNTHLSLRHLFLNHNAQTSPTPLLLEFDRAEGVWLYDKQGNAWMDLISGIGVSNLGHGRPEVKQAIHEQVERYMHLMVYGEFVLSPQVLFAERLAAYLPDALDSVYFVNSGSEAVEGALKLAKRSTGRTEILAFNNSYHGSTHGALSVMGAESFKSAFRPLLPDISFLELNDWNQLQLITTRTACVILETVQGEAGVRIPEQGWLQALRAACTHNGVLLILDEIQCGMGRSGTIFAFEQYQIQPDILLLAKSLGGGMPLGAFIASSSLMSCLTENPVLGHITTFGGHPVSCAAGLAAFDVLIREKLTTTVEEKSRLFEELLVHPLILEVRRKGLLMAVQFADYEQNKKIIDRCIERGLIVDWFLHDSGSMRLSPPLTITADEISKACTIIISVLEEVAVPMV